MKKLKVNNKDNAWIYTITILAFFITIVFSIISEFILSGLGMFFGIIIIFLFIFLGVLFDMIGIAVASSSDKSFNAMASKKIASAKLAIKMIKNSAKVSSFCNDVIGDICGIMSGSAGIIIASSISLKYNTNLSITILLVTGIIAALTIGGKAYGKGIAIENSDDIVFRFAKALTVLSDKKE